MAKSKGLFNKYNVYRYYPEKGNEEIVDYDCFVLRIDGNDPAAMYALKTYAAHCSTPLSTDLMNHIKNTPIKKPDWQVLEEADHIVGAYVENISDAHMETLRQALNIARREVEKNL